MKIELSVNEHKAVGPITDVCDHAPVTVIGHPDDGDDSPLLVCLDCGHADTDRRTFQHTECHREDNPITKTWREHIEDGGFPDA